MNTLKKILIAIDDGPASEGNVILTGSNWFNFVC